MPYTVTSASGTFCEKGLMRGTQDVSFIVVPDAYTVDFFSSLKHYTFRIDLADSKRLVFSFNSLTGKIERVE